VSETVKPSMGAASPPAPPPTPVTCPSCGWPNRVGAHRCEFCTAPLERPLAAARPRPVECPHCGFSSPGLGRALKCPRCGRDYLEPAGPTRKLTVLLADVAARVRQSWQLTVVAVFVGITVFYMAVYQRGSNKMTTAEHMRQIRQRLLIFEGELGGFPASLDSLTLRHGPLPAYVLKDAWDHELRYSASKPLFVQPELGQPVFAECELRSAGPDGEAGDGDDLVWNGVASGR
jgi:hypothetical protein